MHIKQVDADGRIILPQEYRRALRIKDGGSIAMSLTGDKIEILRYQDIDVVKSIIKKAIKSHYYAFQLPIVACDEDKIFSVCGLDFPVSADAPLSIPAKRQLEHNYEHYSRDREHQIPLMLNNDLMIRMMTPLRKENKPIGAIMIVGGAEPFEELSHELRKSVSLLAALIQPQISTL